MCSVKKPDINLVCNIYDPPVIYYTLYNSVIIKKTPRTVFIESPQYALQCFFDKNVNQTDLNINMIAFLFSYNNINPGLMIWKNNYNNYLC